MKLSWHDMRGLPMGSTEAKVPHGVLVGVLFNPNDGHVLAYQAGLNRVVSPSDVTAFHKHQLVVNEEEAFIAPEELYRLAEHGFKAAQVLKKPVLSSSGRNLGRVHNFILETSIDQLLQIEVQKSIFGISFGPSRLFSFEQINKITEKAIVLNEDNESTKEETKAKQQVLAPS